MIDKIRVPKIENIKLLNRFSKQVKIGTLHLTATHLIFVTKGKKSEIWLLHSLIGNVTRHSITAAGCKITIKCKHFLTLNFLVPRDKECQDLYETLSHFSQPYNIEQVYAFSFVPIVRPVPDRASGWTFDLLNEYHRMKLSDRWHISDFNINYSYCDTYPEYLIVPKASTKRTLIGSSKFRSRGRLPVLTYFYDKSNAAIVRCSQPLAGFSARCEEDEQMIADILAASGIDDASTSDLISKVIYLIDTRPNLNTMVNMAQGKGTENEKHYANMRHYTFDIENIHVMRNSLQKLIDIMHNGDLPMASFLAGIDSCAWLKHIRIILKCAMFIADSVRKGISCIIHCSDGWDRTAQACSLAQVLLDPYYRTFEGLTALIEKDWLAFGHKFTDRCGHAGGVASLEAKNGIPVVDQSPTDAKEISPVFTQFLDALHQLQTQHDTAFEYNERLLIDLQEQAHACQFGTFIGNCDKDRHDLKLRERTYSVWPVLRKRRYQYFNHLYRPNDYQIILPDVRIQSISLWRGLYNRFDAAVLSQQNESMAFAFSYAHSLALKAYHTQKESSSVDERMPRPTTNMEIDFDELACSCCHRSVNDHTFWSICFACGRECCSTCLTSLADWRPKTIGTLPQIAELAVYCLTCQQSESK